LGLGSAVSGASEQPPLQLAIAGVPNVGKSTLVNALLGAERVLHGAGAGAHKGLGARAHHLRGETHLAGKNFLLPARRRRGRPPRSCVIPLSLYPYITGLLYHSHCLDEFLLVQVDTAGWLKRMESCGAGPRVSGSGGHREEPHARARGGACSRWD